MKKSRKIILFIMIVCFVILISLFGYYKVNQIIAKTKSDMFNEIQKQYFIHDENISKSKLKDNLKADPYGDLKERLQGIDNLMIVAHPDDETLWGGHHLLTGKWFVLCVTNEFDETRRNEFYKAMNESNNYGVIMAYPDVYWVTENGKKVRYKYEWDDCYDLIQQQINYVVNLKDWKTIATHNPEGDTGHRHHKKIDKMVTDVCKASNKYDDLYYFGKYYTEDQINKLGIISNLSKEDIEKKQNLMLNNYQSQKYWLHNPMIPIEKWIKATDWTK